MRPLRTAVLGSLLCALPLAAQSVDLAALNKIRDEAFSRSQAYDLASELADRYGPRLTGSPQHREAAEWVVGKLEELGLADARIEPFDFGRSWSYERCEVRMMAPVTVPIVAVPSAWTPGTAGTVRGEAVRADLASEEDFEKVRGELAGKIVLLDEKFDAADFGERPSHERWSDAQLGDMLQTEIPSDRIGKWLQSAKKRWTFERKLNEFLVAEGALATVEISSYPNGIVRGGGQAYSRYPDRPLGVPGLIFAVEPYQRITRLLERGETVELELTVDATFHDDDPTAPNVLAELPGSDRKAEIVMAGGHLDSWHLGTGAVDDGAGVAVVMEAVRLLKAAGLVPRRTIRVAFWGAEEQGLVGSRAWVEAHVADREPVAAAAVDDPVAEAASEAEEDVPPFLRGLDRPVRPKGEHAKISAYFNLDYGSGRVRGIYTLGNVEAGAKLEPWFAALSDLGASTVTNNPIPIGGSDHSAFDRVGVPGFMFIQDPLDYFQAAHHASMDTADHLRRDDLVQASVVVAQILWQAANDPERMPRKPMPKPMGAR